MEHEEVVPKGYDEEERYFHQKEVETIEQLRRRRAELDEARRKQEGDQRKADHWMKCPKCGGDLQEVALDPVMVDKCASCQGVYFDKGELELLLESRSIGQKLTKLFKRSGLAAD